MPKKKIEPMDDGDWEEMQIQAELDSVGILDGETDLDKLRERVKLHASNVMDMSVEIWRLRMTYGEKVWQPCNRSTVSIEKERKMYEK